MISRYLTHLKSKIEVQYNKKFKIYLQYESKYALENFLSSSFQPLPVSTTSTLSDWTHAHTSYMILF